MEKTHWATTLIAFLRMLLDTRSQTISIPLEKRDKAMEQLQTMLSSKKTTILKIQQLAGILGFICKCCVPGRAFTHRLHAKTGGLKQCHHVRVEAEMRLDCYVWVQFLSDNESLRHPFVDFYKNTVYADEIKFHTDASKNENYGIGAIFENEWIFAHWEPGFIKTFDQSTEYLELYGILVGVYLRVQKLENRRLTIFCDNLSVCHDKFIQLQKLHSVVASDNAKVPKIQREVLL